MFSSCTVTLPQTLDPVERADSGGNVVVLPIGTPVWSTVVPVDVPTGGFPAEVAFVESNGRPIARTVVESRDDLLRGQFLNFSCHRRKCPAGKYSIRIEFAGDTPPETIPVEVVAHPGS